MQSTPHLLSPIQVTVVTGFLGAGKSTLVQTWLHELPRGETAVIVNERGDIGIDGELLAAHVARLTEITGGCVCCTSQAELISALGEISKQHPAPTRILIETSGAASPAGIIADIARQSGVWLGGDGHGDDPGQGLDRLEHAVRSHAAVDTDRIRAECHQFGAEAGGLGAEPGPVPVLFEDPWVLALNKPSGLAVQGGTGQTRHLDAMLGALGGEETAPRLVHRLDQDTSGVLLLAKTATAARRLGASFKARETEKIYWALVVGAPGDVIGRIDLPLAKKPMTGGEKVAPDTDEDGKTALTLYHVVETRPAARRGGKSLT